MSALTPPGTVTASLPEPEDARIAPYPYGHVHEMHGRGGGFGAAMNVDYERENHVHGTWHSDRLHFFDFSLTSHPLGARGYFEEAARGYQPVGKHGTRWRYADLSDIWQ